jgi:hypothetical protein
MCVFVRVNVTTCKHECYICVLCTGEYVCIRAFELPPLHALWLCMYL